jgi:hypothetical protein
MNKPLVLLAAVLLALAAVLLWPRNDVGTAQPAATATATDDPTAELQSAALTAKSETAPPAARDAIADPRAARRRITGRVSVKGLLPLGQAAVRAIVAQPTLDAQALDGTPGSMWARGLIEAIAHDAPTLATTTVAGDGRFSLEVATAPGRLGLVLDHDHYFLPSPHVVTVPEGSGEIDAGELTPLLGALVIGRVVGFTPPAAAWR